MAVLTKKIKPVAQYHQWAASEITNGDILGISESLGNRSAHTVTVESVAGATTLRLNVGKKIYKNYGASDQFAGMGQGLTRPSPILIAEVEEVRDDIIIESDNIQVWTSSEINIVDIKIISKSPGLKITVT